MSIALHAIARSDAPVLANLFELYVHDFSEWMPLELKESGRFESHSATRGGRPEPPSLLHPP